MDIIDLLLLHKDSHIILNLTPVPKPRMTYRDKIFTNPNHPDERKRQRVCVTKYLKFKSDFTFLYNAEKKVSNFNHEGLKEGILNVVFIIPMPASWNHAKKEAFNQQPCLAKPDRDNLLKAVQDILRPDSDSGIWDGRTTKVWGYKGQIIIYE